MAKYIENVHCPITNNEIDIGLCQDIQFVVDDAIKESVLQDDLDFSLTNKHKELCRNCKKRIDPRL